MTTDRRFCRFSKSSTTESFGMPEVPKDGLCLSAFVLLSPKEAPTSVLMGHMNPGAPWDHLGALDPDRIEAHRHGWMLPSSHLMMLESPDDAARRILAEQLRLPAIPLRGPQVVSEVYTPRRFAGLSSHWDLEFLFRGDLSDPEPPSSEAWTELKFVDLPRTRRAEVARSHEDVLASAGFQLAD
jgi:ADP-ribose pyrophosphatase YjhB (NUDIX family)